MEYTQRYDGMTADVLWSTSPLNAGKLINMRLRQVGEALILLSEQGTELARFYPGRFRSSDVGDNRAVFEDGASYLILENIRA